MGAKFTAVGSTQLSMMGILDIVFLRTLIHVKVISSALSIGFWAPNTAGQWVVLNRERTLQHGDWRPCEDEAALEAGTVL